MSFFKKYTPAGSTPIVTDRRIVRRPGVSDVKPTTTTSTAGSRMTTTTTTTTVMLRRALTPPTDDYLQLRRKKLGVVKSAPNLKRGHDQLNNSLKPPSPESLLGSKRRSKSPQLQSNDDNSSSEDERRSKRSKFGSSSPQSVERARRIIVHPLSFHKTDPKTNKPVEHCEFFNAEQIANLKLPGYIRRSEFRKAGNLPLIIGLHYPGIPHQERYALVKPKDPDELDPVHEIFHTMEKIAQYLLPPEIGEQIHSETSGGIVYRIRKALKNGDNEKFREQLVAYNTVIKGCRRDYTFKKRISGMINLPLPLVEHILSQAYSRTVALEVEGLRNYQAFTSEVYGELLPKLTTKIFKEAGLTSDKIFVDLGSGTGNVVLHAALEVGCESWGCEKMNKPAELAEKQQKEFIARCRMYGINHGSVHLEHDTFLENRRIADVLRRADVLLVNNFAFEPGLNQKLLDMFLDLKEGTQIFSLKPFVPANHVITTRNVENPVNRLRIVEREYFSREVSWTDAGGKYYMQTVDNSMLKDFLKKERRSSRHQSR